MTCNFVPPLSDRGKNKCSVFHQLDAIFQALSDMVLCLDADGRILNYNASDTVTLVEPAKLIPGCHLQEIFPEEVSTKLEAAIRKTIETGKVVSVDYHLQLPVGDHWFEARLVSPTKSEVIVSIRDMTDHARVIEQAQLHLKRLSALRAVDMAITSSFDLNVTLSVILRQVINQLGVDAANILLLDPNSQKLKYAAGLGFRAKVVNPTHLMVGQGYAGIAALERHAITIPRLDDQQISFLFSPNLVQEGFVSYFAVPLIAKGQVQGVMEIYHRSVFSPDDDWLDFLATLAGQTAVAIDSASMFNDLQSTNTELSLAYDAIIESWTRALELTHRESGEHSYRVIDLTIRLAGSMHISETELVHFRRGAILHDIGKLGVPESILNKPGPLNEEEWKIIRNHPTLAYQLLSPIEYLAPALDIPHYHHEHWDGSGYPTGLRGEQIPFSARIFSVVDVYDALTSLRTYRAAWSPTETLNYIHEQSGILFDPAVVNTFLQMMGD